MFLNKVPSFKKMLTIEDLNKCLKKTKNVTLKEKKDIKILIIDDQGYDIDRLKRIGYKDIKVIASFDDMDSLIPYDIILCDINGVAKDIDVVYQGAALAKIIKYNYPTKIVVIFSAKPQKADFFAIAQEVDDFIVKNIQTSDLSAKLATYISILNNPSKAWESTKKSLVKKGVTVKTIALLEHYYVKSIIENKNYSDLMLQTEDEISKEEMKKILSGVFDIIKLCLAVAELV